MVSLNQQLVRASEMYGQVQKMFDDGIIKQSEDGHFMPVMDPEEIELIKSNRGDQSRRRPINEDDIDRINKDLEEMEGDN